MYKLSYMIFHGESKNRINYTAENDKYIFELLIRLIKCVRCTENYLKLSSTHQANEIK